MNKGDIPRQQSIKPTSLPSRQTRLSLQIDERAGDQSATQIVTQPNMDANVAWQEDSPIVSRSVAE